MMLEYLRDFKAVNWRTDLELDLGAGTWSEGRVVQKKHRAVLTLMNFLRNLDARVDALIGPKIGHWKYGEQPTPSPELR